MQMQRELHEIAQKIEALETAKGALTQAQDFLQGRVRKLEEAIRTKGFVQPITVAEIDETVQRAYELARRFRGN